MQLQERDDQIVIAEQCPNYGVVKHHGGWFTTSPKLLKLSATPQPHRTGKVIRRRTQVDEGRRYAPPVPQPKP